MAEGLKEETKDAAGLRIGHGGTKAPALPGHVKRGCAPPHETRRKRNMLTLEALKAYGADTDAGLARCMNMKDFYLRLVSMELSDAHFEALRIALEKQDSHAAFEAAHALKGAVGNLALTPLYAPLCEITEVLRNAQGPVDTGDLLPRIMGALEDLKALAAG